MKVLDGLRIVRRFFPFAKIGQPKDPIDRRIADKLNAIAEIGEPETYREFIALMDRVGLSVVENEVVLDT